MIMAKLLWGTDLGNAYLLIGSTENNTHPETGSHYCTKKKWGKKRKGKEKKINSHSFSSFAPATKLCPLPRYIAISKKKIIKKKLKNKLKNK